MEFLTKWNRQELNKLPKGLIETGDTGFRDTYFAAPRYIDKAHANNELDLLDDSGYGPGDELNRSNGLVAQHTHFGEDSDDITRHQIFHQPNQIYRQPQRHQHHHHYNQDFSFEQSNFNFSNNHRPRSSLGSDGGQFAKNATTNYLDQPDIYNRQSFQNFNIQNPYLGYHNQTHNNQLNHVSFPKQKKTHLFSGIDDEEGIQAALAWSNAYSSDLLYTYIVEQERQFHFFHKPIEQTQTDISVNDRTTLMTWLIRICTSNHFPSMHLEALHLCVSIIDDFLSRVEVEKKEFQLIGVTALLLASKQLIYDPPSMDSLVGLCEKIYTACQIKDCEVEMLNKLDFALHRPTGHTFVDFFAGRLLYQGFRRSDAGPQEKRIIRHLAVARYCLTIGLLSAQFACLFPSVRARAAYICAARILQEPHLDLPFGEEFALPSLGRHSKAVIFGVEVLKKVMSDQTEHGLTFQPRTIDLYSYP